jgi:hypothetical protein
MSHTHRCTVCKEELFTCTALQADAEGSQVCTAEFDHGQPFVCDDCEAAQRQRDIDADARDEADGR